MANKQKVKSRIIFQSMKCPKCGNLELSYPPASWEVIEDGSLAYCMGCGVDFEIKIIPQTRDAELRVKLTNGSGETAEQSEH